MNVIICNKCKKINKYGTNNCTGCNADLSYGEEVNLDKNSIGKYYDSNNCAVLDNSPTQTKEMNEDSKEENNNLNENITNNINSPIENKESVKIESKEINKEEINSNDFVLHCNVCSYDNPIDRKFCENCASSLTKVSPTKKEDVYSLKFGITGENRVDIVFNEENIFEIGTNSISFLKDKDYVSRLHCYIVKKNNAYYLVDTSTNGTYIVINNKDFKMEKGVEYEIKDGANFYLLKKPYNINICFQIKKA